VRKATVSTPEQRIVELELELREVHFQLAAANSKLESAGSVGHGDSQDVTAAHWRPSKPASIARSWHWHSQRSARAN